MPTRLYEKGHEKVPGSGRKKGMPNPVSVEARQLVAEMVNDAAYQARLRRDFALRKLHPTIESLVWAYALGKPKQDIQLTGNVDVNGRIEQERRLFLQLDIADLEQLAMESQALVDRAVALAGARGLVSTDGQEGESPSVRSEPLFIQGKVAGSDNHSSVNQSTEEDSDPINPTDTEG